MLNYCPDALSTVATLTLLEQSAQSTPDTPLCVPDVCGFLVFILSLLYTTLHWTDGGKPELSVAICSVNAALYSKNRPLEMWLNCGSRSGDSLECAGKLDVITRLLPRETGRAKAVGGDMSVKTRGWGHVANCEKKTDPSRKLPEGDNPGDTDLQSQWDWFQTFSLWKCRAVYVCHSESLTLWQSVTAATGS